MELKSVLEKIIESEKLRDRLESLSSFEEVYEFFKENGYEGSAEELQELVFKGMGEYGILEDEALEQVAGGVSGRQVLSACAGLMMLMGATPLTNIGGYASATSVPNASISQSVKNEDEKDEKVFTQADVDKNAEKIVVPEGVTKIDAGAFEDCKNLKEVKLPSTLTVIGSNAFHNCDSLEKINIPEGVVDIEAMAFCGCKNLSNVKLPSTLREIGVFAFFGCEKFTEINIPEGVTAIGRVTFKGCKSLKVVKLPSTIAKITSDAFDECDSIEKIIVPKNVAKIKLILGFKNGSGVDKNRELRSEMRKSKIDKFFTSQPVEKMEEVKKKIREYQNIMRRPEPVYLDIKKMLQLKDKSKADKKVTNEIDLHGFLNDTDAEHLKGAMDYFDDINGKIDLYSIPEESQEFLEYLFLGNKNVKLVRS